ncbi:MAG: molecular chaperone DnaJ [Bacteroidales bacterium]
MKKISYVHPGVCICRRCNGIGKVYGWDEDRHEQRADECLQCRGSGRVKIQKKIEMSIDPFIPGVDDGEGVLT